MVDYRKFRFNKLDGEFSYLKLLLWWPLFGLAFGYIEKYYTVKQYHAVYSPLDDMIPFNEIFVFPYMFWFVFIAGMLIYLLIFDVNCFKKAMCFFMLTYTSTLVIYLIYPTCQELRPAFFERDNFLTQFMQGFYKFDTNTNVCPSIHVMGAVAVFCASLHTERFKTLPWRAFFTMSMLLICASTVFLKQHSILDVFWAIPICIIGYIIAFKSKPTVKKKEFETV